MLGTVLALHAHGVVQQCQGRLSAVVGKNAAVPLGAILGLWRVTFPCV